MGVIYKLKDEVVQYIVNQRRDNPLLSCRQLAESASERFNLHLSKSSVHDVLKESGIITPRGRKPKSKFEIPLEKKKQIQANLSQVSGVIASPKGEAIPERTTSSVEIASSASMKSTDLFAMTQPSEQVPAKPMDDVKIYDGAGKIFQKAALWDLGIYAEEPKTKADRDYYLTYTKGIKIFLQDEKEFLIPFSVPIERCIREAVDGFVNNVRPAMVSAISDESTFKAAMEAKLGFNIHKIAIVDQYDHIMAEFSNIVDRNILYILNEQEFVECKEVDAVKRMGILFFTENIDNNNFIDSLSKIKGSDVIMDGEINVSLLIEDSYEYKPALQQAMEKLNKMCLRDAEGRLLRVKICHSRESGNP